MTDSQTNTASFEQGHKHLVFVLVILALVYFPFVNKAFTIDDTLFLKAAEQILLTPLDFFGGEVNWYGFPDSHFVINKNPPLVSYLIAAVASVFGFSEIALHSFFFLPLALSAVGIYLLGREFNTNPLITMILAVFTPVFLVHGTNVMSDSTLLMFWVWGMVFWFNGTRSNAPIWFLFAGLSVAFGALTKYPGIFLVPLLIYSGIWKYRRPGSWVLAVLIPVVVMIGFEFYSKQLYGKGLFFEAIFYANEFTQIRSGGYFDNTLIGLSFLGGCIPVALLLMPLTGGRLVKMVMAVFAAAIAILIYTRGSISHHAFVRDGSLDLGLLFQFCAFALAGVCLVIACVKEVSKRLDHDSVFLLLWFFGIFVFACYLNWTINARSFILLVPAAGILLSRRLEEWGGGEKTIKRNISYALIGTAGLVAVATVHADYVWANTARSLASELTQKYSKQGKVRFQGHWGFQFYMEKSGVSPMNLLGAEISPGDFVIIPVNNTGLARLPDWFVMVEDRYVPHGSFVATMSPNRSAGFYADAWGPIPYVVETPANERYLVFRATAR